MDDQHAVRGHLNGNFSRRNCRILVNVLRKSD